MKGVKVGWLTVIGEAPRPKGSKDRSARWWCKCRCGVKKSITRRDLISGNVVSCGCKKHGYTHSIKHHRSRTRIYTIWISMKNRCKRHKRYAGRGIRVCDRWEKFENFYEDMSPTYSDDLTLDRIDNDRNYTPENCRWADMQTQAENRKGVIYVEIDGERKSLARACRDLRIPATTVLGRFRRLNITAEEAIEMSLPPSHQQRCA